MVTTLCRAVTTTPRQKNGMVYLLSKAHKARDSETKTLEQLIFANKAPVSDVDSTTEFTASLAGRMEAFSGA